MRLAIILFSQSKLNSSNLPFKKTWKPLNHCVKTTTVVVVFVRAKEPDTDQVFSNKIAWTA
jgi:hypothetical protein